MLFRSLLEKAFGGEVALGSCSVSLTDAAKAVSFKSGVSEKQAKAKVEEVLSEIIETKPTQRLTRSTT